MIDFYSKNCECLSKQYEKISPEEINAKWSHFIPTTKSLVLYIGSGSGRDAAWLAEMGHEIVAVDPADNLREKAEKLHPHASIQWINGSLPALTEVYKLNLRFDLILVSAVWMLISPGLRERSLNNQRRAGKCLPDTKKII